VKKLERDGQSGLNPSERKKLLKELQRYFEELRKISNPQLGAIASAEMQPLWDPRTFKSEFEFGPFVNEHDFNSFLRYGFSKNFGTSTESCSPIIKEEIEEIQKLVAMQNQES
jgi:hypothetical protein